MFEASQSPSVVIPARNSISDNVGSPRAYAEKFYHEFKADMAYLMKQWSDDNVQTYEFHGMMLDKGTPGESLFIQMNDQENQSTFTMLVDALKFEETLAKKLENII